MSSPRRQEFDREFRRHVDRHAEALPLALRGIIEAPRPPAVKLLAFVMEADWRCFPVLVLAMDDRSPTVSSDEPPFRGQLLPDAGPLIPPGAIDQDGYEEAGVATFERGAEILAEWIGECWHVAGGASFPIPAYAYLHDDSRYYDLHARRWVEESDVWP